MFLRNTLVKDVYLKFAYRNLVKWHILTRNALFNLNNKIYSFDKVPSDESYN